MGKKGPSYVFEAARPGGSAWRGRRALPRCLCGRPQRLLAGAVHPTRPQRVPRRSRLACSLPLAMKGSGFRRRGPCARRRRRLRGARGRGDLVRCPLLAAVPRLPPLLLRPCPPLSRGRVRVSEARVPPSSSFCGRVRFPPAAVSASLRPDCLPFSCGRVRYPLAAVSAPSRPVCLPPPSAAVSATLPRPCPRL
jgi:hypothetical protein